MSWFGDFQDMLWYLMELGDQPGMYKRPLAFSSTQTIPALHFEITKHR